MTKLAIRSAKSWLMLAAVAVFASSASVSHAAVAGADDAGNYTIATFTNSANSGTGFGAWEISLAEDSMATLSDSTASAGDVNSTNDLAFMFYGGTNGTYADAIRPFNAALIPGDSISFSISYNWDGGNRGFNILDSGNNNLLNVGLTGGNTLAYNFEGDSNVVVATDYNNGTSVVAVTIVQLADNELDLTLTRNDGLTANSVSTTLSADAAKVKFYNGGHAADNLNYALFVNDLAITESMVPTLAIDSRDGMVAGATNMIYLIRGGDTTGSVTMTVNNSDGTVASVPPTVTFDPDAIATNFSITGLMLGDVTISVEAAGFPTASVGVAVYDLGYDDSTYGAGNFTNGGNSGSGFKPWIFVENDGAADGYTNFTGAFIGDSTTDGGGDVNTSQGAAFGLYANQVNNDTNEAFIGDSPFFNAVRQFDNELGVGEVAMIEFGVNFRNGSKGVAFQNGGSTVFEVGVFADDYWYVNPSTTNGPVSLGWDYAADTAVEVELARVTADLYDITIIRSGSMPETNELGLVDLGSTAPNEVRAYIFGTEAGGENNLYFNRLALYSGEEFPVLDILGNSGMVVDYTNTFTVTRTGSTNAALTVTLASDDTGVAAVPASVIIPAGALSVTAEVVGVGNGEAEISATAVDAIGDMVTLDVFDVAYDDSSYYDATNWVQLSNGGVGFGGWDLTANNVVGDGFTNVSGNVLADSASSAGDINSSSNNAFAVFASKEGTGGPDQDSSAIRGLSSELAINQKLSIDIGVNFRNGAKGVVVQNSGFWLFEVAVLNDDYVYRNWAEGDGDFTSLGWTNYSSHTSIRLEMTRIGTDSYDVVISRSGGFSESNILSGVSLDGNVLNQLRFYTYLTDAGPENYLYFNRLGIESVPASGYTDGIPDTWWDQYGIALIDRVAGTDLEPDGKTSGEEYIADTNPNDAGSVLDDEVTTLLGDSVMTMTIGPTTNSRVYDVWWNDDLLADPQVWTRYGLDVAGDGAVLNLTVTNDVAPSRSYRTGVALP